MKKIIGIFIMILLIGTTMPVIGILNEPKSKNSDYYFNNEFVPGELIVKFKEPRFSYVSVNNLNEKYKVSSMEQIFRNSENTILDNIYLLKVSEDYDILSIVEDYAMNPNVEYAEPNGIAYPFVIPNDPDFENQWYLDNNGQFNGKIDSDIDAPEAWDKIKGNPEVVIAIVDSGIDYTHPDLESNIWINEDEIPDNEIDDDENGYIDDIRGWDFAYYDNDPKDLHGHGTVCAGVVGGVTDNNIGLAGVSWNSKIMIVQISNETWASQFQHIAQGIKYAADNGADIISLSFGWYNQNDNIIKDSCDYAYDKGVVLIAAAGNDGVGINYIPNPASFENVIAVAGTNNNDSRMDTFVMGKSCVSNYGFWVDVAAPGQNIYSTMPTYEVYFNREYELNMNYTFVSGTSLSAPITAGVAALILSNNSSLNQSEVKSTICKYTEPYNSIYYLGKGRVNAYRAIEKAKSIDNSSPWIFRLVQRFPILEFLL